MKFLSSLPAQQENNESHTPSELCDVTLILNLYKHSLTVVANGRTVAQISGIRGKEIFPFVLFDKRAYYPVQLKYMEGPSGTYMTLYIQYLTNIHIIYTLEAFQHSVYEMLF